MCRSGVATKRTSEKCVLFKLATSVALIVGRDTEEPFLWPSSVPSETEPARRAEVSVRLLNLIIARSHVPARTFLGLSPLQPEEKIFLGVIFGFVGRGVFGHKFEKLRIVFLYICTQITSGKFQPQLPVSCGLMSGAQHYDYTCGVVSGPGLQIAAGISRATTSMIPATQKQLGS